MPIFACAYAWIQNSISHLFRNKLNSTASKYTYRTQYEDEFGCVDCRYIRRPQFYGFIYDNQPLIDEHNKQRQIILNLENVGLQIIVGFFFS